MSKTKELKGKELVEKIHAEFDDAAAKIFVDAAGIMNEKVDTSKADRMKALGFTACEEVKKVDEHSSKVMKARANAEQVAYFTLHYPNNKFITEDVVQDICKKYGLYLGASEHYTGTIPEKNLAEIEAFKLREEDYEDVGSSFGQAWLTADPFGGGDSVSWTSSWNDIVEREAEAARRRMTRGQIGLINFISQPPRSGKEQTAADFLKNYDISEQERHNEYLRQFEDSHRKLSAAIGVSEKKKRSFKIVAPKQDFKAALWVSVDGYTLVEDPIVLQPVRGGYLIVSKWGPEGSDPSLTNEKMN